MVAAVPGNGFFAFLQGGEGEAAPLAPARGWGWGRAAAAAEGFDGCVAAAAAFSTG